MLSMTILTMAILSLVAVPSMTICCSALSTNGAGCRQLCFSRLALTLDLEPSPNPAQVLYYSKMVYGLLSFPFLLFVTPMVALTLALTLTLFRTLAPAPAQTPR